MEGAREITGLSSMATRTILAELAAAYERDSGCRVALAAMGGVEAARRVRAGEVCDVVILASGIIAQLEDEGRLVPGSRVELARSRVAAAVPAGAPRPDIGDEAAVRRAMLGARRLCYSTGPSGDGLKRLWERWGIAETIAPRAVQAPPGLPVGTMLARGEADLGFQQLSELLGVPGIDLLGCLPDEVAAVTVFAAGVSATSSRSVDARAFLAYLASPGTETVKRRHGMEAA